MKENFYTNQPSKSFWKRSISDRHVTQLNDLTHYMPDFEGLKIATAGSCFAQHIGKSLIVRGLNYLDYEPFPKYMTATDAEKFGYGIYSCRYGNIYTVRQLWQLFQEAFEIRKPLNIIWQYRNRYFDALRPGIEPDGFETIEELLYLRQYHLKQVRRLFEELDIFIFTLGLTEAWTSIADDTTYPISPGVIAGQYNPKEHRLDNFRYPQIYNDLTLFIEGLRQINRSAKLLLTVSPVPLAATATNDHVLTATIYSKSTLRAVAGDMSRDFDDVYYFPSYEIIASHPSRGMYFNPDLRTVSPAGVAEVMKHFFSLQMKSEQKGESSSSLDNIQPRAIPGYEHCEEALLDAEGR